MTVFDEATAALAYNVSRILGANIRAYQPEEPVFWVQEIVNGSLVVKPGYKVVSCADGVAVLRHEQGSRNFSTPIELVVGYP